MVGLTLHLPLFRYQLELRQLWPILLLCLSFMILKIVSFCHILVLFPTTIFHKNTLIFTTTSFPSTIISLDYQGYRLVESMINTMDTNLTSMQLLFLVCHRTPTQLNTIRLLFPILLSVCQLTIFARNVAIISYLTTCVLIYVLF